MALLNLLKIFFILFVMLKLLKYIEIAGANYAIGNFKTIFKL